MNEITELLENDFDYQEGFAVFCKYSSHQSMMSWLGRKQDMKKLKYELQKLAKSPKLKARQQSETDINRFYRMQATQKVAKTEQQNTKEEKDFVSFDKLPVYKKIDRATLSDAARAIYDSISEKYKLMRAAHEKMKGANSNVGRAEFRAQVLAFDAEIQALWKAFDAEKTDDTDDTKKVALPINVASYRTYLSNTLKKKELSDELKAEVKRRAEAILATGKPLSEKILAGIKKHKIEFSVS